MLLFHTNTQNKALGTDGYNTKEFVACLKIFSCNIYVSVGWCSESYNCFNRATKASISEAVISNSN